MASRVEPTRERLIFIDFLRGYAILMMLQGHTVNVVLAEQWRDTQYPAFAIWYYFTGLTAPTFFFAAGFIFSFLMARGEELGGQRLRKGLKRCGSLMILGWVFHLKPPFFISLAQGDFSVIGEVVGRSHVLHVIALSLLLVIGLWVLVKRRKRLFVVVTLVTGQLAFLLGPVLATWSGDDPLWLRPLGTFLSSQNAYFPLFPWAGHGLNGAALGVLAWQTKWYREPRWFAVLFGVGLLVKGLTGLTPEASEAAYWRGGEVLMLLAVVGGACHGLQQKGWEDFWLVRVIARCGQETLTIFCLHCIVLYGVWFGIGLSRYFPRTLGPWQTVGTAIVIELLFITLALNLQKVRKAWPWMRLLR